MGNVGLWGPYASKGRGGVRGPRLIQHLKRCGLGLDFRCPRQKVRIRSRLSCPCSLLSHPRFLEKHPRFLYLLHNFRNWLIIHASNHGCGGWRFNGREACACRSRLHYGHFRRRLVSWPRCCRMDEGHDRHLRRLLHPFSLGRSSGCGRFTDTEKEGDPHLIP